LQRFSIMGGIKDPNVPVFCWAKGGPGLSNGGEGETAVALIGGGGEGRNSAKKVKPHHKPKGGG